MTSWTPSRLILKKHSCKHGVFCELEDGTVHFLMDPRFADDCETIQQAAEIIEETINSLPEQWRAQAIKKLLAKTE